MDTVFAVPGLTTLLPPESRAALSGCNKQLRTQIRKTTRIITLKGCQLDTVSRSEWPQLALIMLPHTDEVSSAILHFIKCTRNHLQVLALLTLGPVWPDSLLSGSMQMVLLTVPKTTNSDQVQPPYQHLVPAFLHLQRLSFRYVRQLSLSSCKLDAKSLALLTAVHWPLMTTLDVSDNDLDHIAMSQLARGAWPMMQQLLLSSNKIDTAAMAELTHGNWPLLRKLDLSTNPLSEPTALSMLTKANWLQVQYVTLHKVRLSPACVHSLLQVSWQFRHLCLSSASLDASAVLMLAQGHLPNLVTLVLCDNKLTHDAVRHLVSGSFLHLQFLHLSKNRLDTAAVQQLVRGDWPELEVLDLADNCLDNYALDCLAQGDCWPYLRRLSLEGNNLDAVGVQSLTTAEWGLTLLSLDIKTMCEATRSILGIDPEHLKAAFNSVRGPEGKLEMYVPRHSKRSSCGEVIWPLMSQVLIMHSPASPKGMAG